MTDTVESEFVSILRADLDNPLHAKAIQKLINAYAQSPLGIGNPLPNDVLDAMVPGLRAHPGTIVLLAWNDDAPVGIAVCLTGFSTFTAKPLLNLHDLFVMETHQGKGIGRQLLNAVETEGRQLGCGRLTLEVRTDNHNAKHLYQTFGFDGGDDNADTPDYRFWTKTLN